MLGHEYVFYYFQLNILLDKTEDALADFERCIALQPDFAMAHAQKCYTIYKYESLWWDFWLWQFRPDCRNIFAVAVLRVVKWPLCIADKACSGSNDFANLASRKKIRSRVRKLRWFAKNCTFFYLYFVNIIVSGKDLKETQ